MLTFATLSVHKFVNSVGAAVGFASIIAVAILILLYFAHARETATLRERLDEAQARIGGLEARVAQLLGAQAAAQRGRAPVPVTPAPVTPSPVRPMGSAVASVRRVPGPVGAAVAGTAGAAAITAASRAAASTQLPAAPAGMGGPALASATKLIPDPVPRTAGNAPDDTIFVSGAAVAAAANGSSKSAPKPQVAPAPALTTAAAATAAAAAAATAGGAEPKTSGADAAGQQTAGADAAGQQAPGADSAGAPPTPVGATQTLPAVAAASARTPSASPRDGGAPPPRVQIGAEGAAAGAALRRVQARPPEPFLPSEDGGKRKRLSGRLVPMLIGGIAIAVIIVGLIVINNNSGSTTGNVSHDNSSQTGENVSNQQHKPVPFKPSKYRVAVLNGTAVSGLAGDVSTKLATDGFKKGTATNAASQTHGSTIVYYVPGHDPAQNKLAARNVAKKLSLPDSRVQTASQQVIKSCSVNAAGTSLGSCDGNVIVLVGSDRAGLASSGSSG